MGVLPIIGHFALLLTVRYIYTNNINIWLCTKSIGNRVFWSGNEGEGGWRKLCIKIVYGKEWMLIISTIFC